MSDCQGVVKVVRSILQGDAYDHKHEDADLLHYLSEIINTKTRHFLAIQWMPGHLDDPQKYKKKEKYLKTGGQPCHIRGNVNADDLAKRGANQHTTNQTRYYLANARKAVTKSTT